MWHLLGHGWFPAYPILQIPISGVQLPKGCRGWKTHLRHIAQAPRGFWATFGSPILFTGSHDWGCGYFRISFLDRPPNVNVTSCIMCHIWPPSPEYYFLIRFTLISRMINFGLSGAEFSPRAEKLDPWISKDKAIKRQIFWLISSDVQWNSLMTAP